MRTLADLIAFNIAHCAKEMRYFGQELFELAEATSGDLSDPDYLGGPGPVPPVVANGRDRCGPRA